jgi:site-specific DNA-cytosine methylase
VRLLDLYCGMGGLSLGLALALEGAEVLGLDADRWAVETYNLNLSRLGCKATVQDVLEWEPEGGFDLMVGGSPCQPFSLANTLRRGEEHPLFPTFPRFFDLVLVLRPKAFILENVKGLALQRFRHYLHAQLARASGDYRVQIAVLDASRYGVPQRRERLFAVGIRRDLDAKFKFPEPTHAPQEHVTLDGRKIHRWLTLREAIGDLMVLPPLEGKKLVQTNPRHGKPADLDRPSRVIKVDGRGGDICNDTILIPLSPEQAERIMKERLDTSRHWGGWPSQTAWRGLVGRCLRTRSRAPRGETIVLPFMNSKGEVVELPWTEYQSIHPPLSPDEPCRALVSHLAKSSRDALVAEHVMTEVGGWDTERSDWGSRVMDPGRPAFTITEKHRSGQLLPAVYRRLTVRECLRIQSFPDWWRFPWDCSVSKKYRLVGEAVPPILAYRLGVALGKALGCLVREPPREEEWALPYFTPAFADYF